MSYNEDYREAYNAQEKIPFDDTPISRDLPQKKSGPFKRTNQKTPSSRLFKAVVACTLILFCLNIVLVGMLVYNIRNGGNRYVNVFDSTITVSGDANGISSYAIQKAWYNSVCIAAGGRITDNNSFYKNSSSRGSGTILEKNDEKGYLYIITCQHVIDGYEDSVYVLFASYLKPIKATVVGYSVAYDVAVLKVTDLRNLDACTAMTEYDSQLLSIGETCFAVGNSLSGGLSVTGGNISRINKEISVEGTISREIQVDAAINPGNSGGGLFNAEGKFIGLVNAKLSSAKSGNSTITVEGTSYAIPATLALGIAKSIISNGGSPSNVRLGVTFAHDENYPVSSVEVNGKLFDNYKVIVSDVSSGTIASGILRSGDEIVSFSYTDLSGKVQVVNMYNMYCFDDISFNVMKNSTIEFTINRTIPNEKGKVVKIVASNFAVQK